MHRLALSTLQFLLRDKLSLDLPKTGGSIFLTLIIFHQTEESDTEKKKSALLTILKTHFCKRITIMQRIGKVLGFSFLSYIENVLFLLKNDVCPENQNRTSFYSVFSLDA